MPARMPPSRKSSVPVKLQVALFTKLLGYDVELAPRAGQWRAAIVYKVATAEVDALNALAYVNAQMGDMGRAVELYRALLDHTVAVVAASGLRFRLSLAAAPVEPPHDLTWEVQGSGGWAIGSPRHSSGRSAAASHGCWWWVPTARSSSPNT